MEEKKNNSKISFGESLWIIMWWPGQSMFGGSFIIGMMFILFFNITHPDNVLEKNINGIVRSNYQISMDTTVDASLGKTIVYYTFPIDTHTTCITNQKPDYFIRVKDNELVENKQASFILNQKQSHFPSDIVARCLLYKSGRLAFLKPPY